MELLFASDLHFGASRQGDQQVMALAEHACATGADLLVLVGDLANDRQTLDVCLSLFDRFEGAKLAVPGNHDIWTLDDPAVGSWERHDHCLPEAFRRRGFHPLHLAPFRQGQVALAGSMGWYDGSFRDPIGIDDAHYRAKEYPGRPRLRWGDARFARFELDDEAVATRLLERLEAQLEQLADAEHVLAAVHHLVSRRQLFHPRCLISRHWRFLNAFLGSERFGAALTRRPNVRQVFCGHVHLARSVIQGGVRLTSIGSDDGAKQLVRASPTTLLERRWFGEPFDWRTVRPRRARPEAS